MNKLEKYLKHRGISQRAFANKVNTTPNNLNKLVRGLSTPSLRLAYEIEQQTGGLVTVYDWILEGREKEGVNFILNKFLVAVGKKERPAGNERSLQYLRKRDHLKDTLKSIKLQSVLGVFLKNMTDYSDFTPIKKFKLVLQSHPQAALLYFSLWKRRAKNNTLSIKRNDIKGVFLISPTLFRNHLFSLGRLDILSFDETFEYFNIHFISLDDE